MTKFLDRVHGAWLGRIAGCMLGKSVEGWGHDMIRDYLEFIGEYPMSNYVPPAGDKLPEIEELARRTVKQIERVMAH